MNEDRRAVLERVARGDLSPADAAALLDEMESATAAATAAETPGDRAARVRVTRSFGMAEIVGDPGVQEAVAEGPHVARREGDTLVIEGQDDVTEGAGFVFGMPFRRGRPHRNHWGFGEMTLLRVRVNPDLPLEVRAQAGSVTVRGVRGPIRAGVHAGRAEIEGFASTLDLAVQAGSVRASGRLDRGASHVRCGAGSVQIHLEPGSSVRVAARTNWGMVSLGGDEDARAWTLGGGDGTLDIDSSMGSVRVSADR